MHINRVVPCVSNIGKLNSNHKPFLITRRNDEIGSFQAIFSE
jgi:hypothetical protein